MAQSCAEKLNTFIYSLHTEGGKSCSTKKCIFFPVFVLSFWQLDHNRWEGRRRCMPCRPKFNYVYIGGGGGDEGFSVSEWAYPEDLFCFKRRVKSDRSRVCHTLAMRHKQPRTLSTWPTAECLSTLVQSQSSNKKKTSTGSSDWSWCWSQVASAARNVTVCHFDFFWDYDCILYVFMEKDLQ